MRTRSVFAVLSSLIALAWVPPAHAMYRLCLLRLGTMNPGEIGAFPAPTEGEVVTVQSTTGSLYIGKYFGTRNIDGEKFLVLEIGGRKVRLAIDLLTPDGARLGAAVPELFDLHPDEPVMLQSASGAKRTGYVEGFDQDGSIVFRMTRLETADGKIETHSEGKVVRLEPSRFDFKKDPPLRLVPDVYDVTGPEMTVLRPRQLLKGFPESSHVKAWHTPPYYVYQPIEKAGVSKDTARVSADRMMRDLDNILIDLRMAMARLDFSDPRNNAEVDAILKDLFARMHHPDMMKDTGYKNAEREGKNRQKAALSGWVQTERAVAVAAQSMRGYAAVSDGYVWPFIIEQKVPGLFGRKVDATRYGPNDKNNRKLYVEQLLVDAEEHYHLVQMLRSYAGYTGTEINISNWARKSGASFPIDIEADVYAAISEKMGNLGEYWRDRYYNRRYVPRDLPLAPRPR